MKWIIFFLASICIPSIALGQSPPTVGGKPLVMIKPQSPSAQPIVPRLRACLAIEDMTKERLDCYDAVVPPQPRRPAPAAKVIADCRHQAEEDARLLCFNRFLELPAAGAPARSTATSLTSRIAGPAIVAAPVIHRAYVKRGRGGCGSRGGAGYRLPNGKCAGRRR